MKLTFCRLMTLLMLLSLIPLCAADSAPEANSRIVGRVMSQRGQIMPNLLVKLMLPRGMKDKFPTTQQIKGGKIGYIETTTDGNGNFSFDRLPAGEYSVISELEGTGRGKVDITVGRNQTCTVQILLKPRRGEQQQIKTG